MQVRKKQIKETRTKQVEEFVAEDGTVFSCPHKCMEHERTLVLEKTKTIKQAEDLPWAPNFNEGERRSDHQYRWFFLETKEDVEILEAAYGPRRNLGFERKKGEDCLLDHIGHWVCLHIYPSGRASFTTLDEGMKYVSQVLDALGYTMSFHKNDIACKNATQQNKAFEIYAGCRALGNYTPIERFDLNAKDAPKCVSGTPFEGLPLPQHCDIFEKALMKQIVDTTQRHWNLKDVDKMWISTMLGTQRLEISLVVKGWPTTYCLSEKDSEKVFALVNSWIDNR